MLYADEAYVQWLKNLKPGDEVACDFTWNDYFQIKRVARITPTGRIRLEDDSLYNQSGVRIGNEFSKIVPVTNEVRLSKSRHDALRYLMNFDYTSLPTEALLKILEVIKEHENGQIR